MIEDSIVDRILRPVFRVIGRTIEWVVRSRDVLLFVVVVGGVIVGVFAIAYFDIKEKKEKHKALWDQRYAIYQRMTGNPHNLSRDEVENMGETLIVREDAKEIPCNTLESSE